MITCYFYFPSKNETISTVIDNEQIMFAESRGVYRRVMEEDPGNLWFCSMVSDNEYVKLWYTECKSMYITAIVIPGKLDRIKSSEIPQLEVYYTRKIYLLSMIDYCKDNLNDTVTVEHGRDSVGVSCRNIIPALRSELSYIDSFFRSKGIDIDD